MRALRPLWRERGGRGAGDRGLRAARSRSGLDRADLSGLVAAWRARATRSTVRYGTSRRRVSGRSVADACRPRAAACVSRRPSPSRSASPEEMAARALSCAQHYSSAQAQAWRRWRRGASCRRSRGCPRCEADRRCQRGLAYVMTSNALLRGGEGGSRRADRAAAARRRRRARCSIARARSALRRRVGA